MSADAYPDGPDGFGARLLSVVVKVGGDLERTWEVMSEGARTRKDVAIDYAHEIAWDRDDDYFSPRAMRRYLPHCEYLKVLDIDDRSFTVSGCLAGKAIEVITQVHFDQRGIATPAPDVKYDQSLNWFPRRAQYGTDDPRKTPSN